MAVVICTRDRPESLLQTLESIWTQSRLPNELIVMDDGELPKDVRDQIAESCKKWRIPLNIRRTARRGLTRARNEAAALSISDILVYLDDDVTCDGECLARMAECMSDPLVAGATAMVEEPRFASRSAKLYQWSYRLAGWWHVRPKGRPEGPEPDVLRRPELAREARWLSGAAMALRREIVLRYRFDESLTRYALGEDREMGYRLAPKHWLIETRRAKVIHRRDVTQRTDPWRLGYMTSRNYLYILRKTCEIGVGEALLIGWGLFVLAAMHLVWAIGPSRRQHLAELGGMIEGVFAGLREKSCLGERPRRSNDGVRTPAQVYSDSAPAKRSDRRVLFVTNRLENGGAERMLISLVQRLPKFGVRPYILCLKDAGPLSPQCREHAIPVFEGLLHSKTDAAVIPRLQRIIVEHGIDIVVAAHSGGDRMFWSTLAGRTTGVPVVVWSHWFPLPNQHHFERANRALYRFVDSFVALGEAHRLALIRHEHVPAGRITVIPNAIELGRFLGDASSKSPIGPTRAEARRRLRLSKNQFAVAIIANLRREKRHDVFIEAARRLAADHSEMRFLIIGDGPNRNAVHAAAAASGLNHEILRLTGPRDDVPELLAGIDVTCLCSEQECFSVTMLEAAAAGCPFVGPDTGSLPEFLEDRVTGLVIKPADVSSLADALLELSADAALRQRVVGEAKKRVFARFGIESMAKTFADLFGSLPARAMAPRGVGRPRLHRRTGTPTVREQLEADLL